MKKTTQSKFSKQLTKYSALAAAMVGVAETNGQISYTNVDPDFMGGIGDEFLLDFNNDGTDDFAIRHNGSNSLFLYPLASNNEFLGSGGGNYAYPYALSSSVAISNSASGSWINNGYSTGNASLNYGASYNSTNMSSSCSFGNFCDVVDRFMGLRFDVGGNIHYGWVRLDVSAIGDAWTVKDFAYNTVPDAPINTGQETLGLPNNDLDQTRIVTLNKTIALYNFPVNSSYSIIDLNGKQVLRGTTQLEQHVIEAQTLSNGIYIIEINGIENKTIRKKIVL